MLLLFKIPSVFSVWYFNPKIYLWMCYLCFDSFWCRCCCRMSWILSVSLQCLSLKFSQTTMCYEIHTHIIRMHRHELAKNNFRYFVFLCLERGSQIKSVFLRFLCVHFLGECINQGCFMCVTWVYTCRRYLPQRTPSLVWLNPFQKYVRMWKNACHQNGKAYLPSVILRSVLKKGNPHLLPIPKNVLNSFAYEEIMLVVVCAK